MSRIGKRPVEIPSGIDVTIADGVITLKKGKTQSVVDTKGNVNIDYKDNTITFSPLSDSSSHRAFWGTYRSLTANAVTGLDKGFEKKLEINGVGYKATVKGNSVELHLGYSHPINYPIAEGVSMSVEKNILTIKGHDKQLLGQIAAEIRSLRPPEPYKGKGVKYLEEHIVRKAGKTAKK